MDGFDWKHPTDAMKGYKSPVDIYYRDILEQVKEATDNYVMPQILFPTGGKFEAN